MRLTRPASGAASTAPAYHRCLDRTLSGNPAAVISTTSSVGAARSRYRWHGQPSNDVYIGQWYGEEYPCPYGTASRRAGSGRVGLDALGDDLEPELAGHLHDALDDCALPSEFTSESTKDLSILMTSIGVCSK
jgi:hypothetical protein